MIYRNWRTGYDSWFDAKTFHAYDSSFFPDTVKLWNLLIMRLSLQQTVSASSLSVFKRDIRGYRSNLTYVVCLFFWLVPCIIIMNFISVRGKYMLKVYLVNFLFTQCILLQGSLILAHPLCSTYTTECGNIAVSIGMQHNYTCAI